MTEQEARALDAEVAAKVMGLTIVAHDWPCGCEPDGCGYTASTFRPAAGWFDAPDIVYPAPDVSGAWPPRALERYPGGPEDEPREAANVLPVPFYSTDITSAWEVIEKLRELWRGKLRVGVIADHKGYTCDVVAYMTGHGRLAVAEADTAAEAICRAALRAVDR